MERWRVSLRLSHDRHVAVDAMERQQMLEKLHGRSAWIGFLRRAEECGDRHPRGRN